MTGLLTRSCVFAAALFALCSCDGADPADPAPVPAHALVRVAGDWQRGMGLETLREPLTVRAIDPVTLKPIPRLAVRFTVERNEEHTSELQSPVVISYAVFCLKKKK